MPCLEQPAGLRRLAGRILDRLCLVEHHVVVFAFAVLQHVAAQRAVGREDHIMLDDRSLLVAACAAGVVEHTQPRGEPSRLLDPVEHQALGHDHQ
jgi:hypothetical protein